MKQKLLNNTILIIALSISAITHAFDSSPAQNIIAQFTDKINTNPDDFTYYFQCANELCRQGWFNEAIDYYQQTIAIAPACYQAYYNQAIAYLGIGNDAQARTCHEQALRIEPNYTRSLQALGTCYKKEHNFTKAIELYNKVLTKEPNNAETLAQLGRTYSELEDIEQALAYLQKAVEFEPTNNNYQLDYANLLTMQNKTKKALDIYYALLSQEPNNPNILYNIAYTLKKQGNIIDSLPYYQAAIAENPTNCEAHFGYSVACLTLGNFNEGWKEYEWRWNRTGHPKRDLHKPEWQGEALEGKTILLHAEQGLGDTLQFIRFAHVIKNMGAKVIVAVQSPLKQLLTLCPYIDKVFSLEDPIDPFDLHLPLMSLPRVLQTTIDSIPHTIPYIFADQRLVDEWRLKLSSEKRIKVGICWQGNPNYSTAFLRHAVAAKSMPLKLFERLSNIPGVRLYSLQKISGEDQLTENIGHIVHEFTGDFDQSHGRFMDTAAVIKNLDLVITIDTSICHLAGALGVPTWLLLPNPADWRWLINRNDSPWYPTMRLFKQATPGDWENLLHIVANELEQSIVNRQPIAPQITLVDTLEKLQHHANTIHDPLVRQAFFAEIKALEILNSKTSNNALALLSTLTHTIIQRAEKLTSMDPLSIAYRSEIKHISNLIEQREIAKQQASMACQVELP